MDNLEDEGSLAPTLQSLLQKESLKWIFVGGKGGVGKTTCSSSLAVQLSKVRENVLIISTDPAHNLSDAFGQKFTKDPTLINGFQNLYAMEIETNMDPEIPDFLEKSSDSAFIQELVFSIPGIDEALSFAEVMKQVQSMKFSVIVFDTAPTGHTLRLLSFPATLEKAFSKFVGIKSKISGLFSQFSSLMGTSESQEQMASKLEKSKQVIEEVHKQFTNPDLTTFVCVCIPEFLSVYETERLIQELAKFQIDTENIIVNQVLFPPPNSSCQLCKARTQMQKKYLGQINDLYAELFHVVKLPLLNYEIRGVELLNNFSKYLLEPYQPTDS